jgi:hypothetical protein
LHPDIKYSEEGEECKWNKGSVCWDYPASGLLKPIFWNKYKCDLEFYKDDLTSHKEM